MTNQVGYAGGGTGTEDTNNRPSRNIWKGSPFADIRDGYKAGTAIFEKFDNGPAAAASTTFVSGGGYRLSTGSGCTIAGDPALGGGIIMTTGGSNTQAGMAGFQQPFQLTAGKDFWWEARIEVDAITDSQTGWIMGLADATALSATVPLTAAGAIADLNIVGFHRNEADGDMLDTVYRANGVPAVTVKADAVTLVAATAVKIGMQLSARNNVLTFYKNGVALADTKTVPDGGGTDFPADVTLGLIMAGVSAATGTNTISWIRACQEAS